VKYIYFCEKYLQITRTMNKETLIQNLKQKVGETDFQVLSDQTVDGIVTPLLPLFEDDSKVTDETYALPVQVFKNYIGQYRHDVKAGITAGIDSEKTRLTSEKDAAIAAFKAQWEKDHPDTRLSGGSTDENSNGGAGGNPNGGAGGNPNGGAGLTEADVAKKVDELLTAKLDAMSGKDGVLGKMNELLTSLDNQRKAERISAITSAIEQHITEKEGGELTHEQSRALHYALKDFDIDEKVSLDDLKKNFEKSYEATYKDLYPNGGMPFSNANGGGDGGNSAFEDFMKRRNEATKTASAEQEALKKKFV
jgi:hypothetical protein